MLYRYCGTTPLEWLRLVAAFLTDGKVVKGTLAQTPQDQITYRIIWRRIFPPEKISEHSVNRQSFRRMIRPSLAERRSTVKGPSTEGRGHPFDPIPESVDSNPKLAALRRLIALRGSGVIYYILPWLAHYMHMDVRK